MIVAVHGTSDFDDYQVFLRAMSVALSGMKEGDKEFTISYKSDGRISVLNDEIKKCICLCSNCHREEHDKKKETTKITDNDKIEEIKSKK